MMRIVTEKRSSLPTRTLENSTVDTRCPMAGSGTKTNYNFFIFTRLASSTEDIFISIYCRDQGFKEILLLYFQLC